jgi:NAD(P)-dependent dehydrogenase (short-subunit alcohol dehydrogenase family)
MNTAVITGATSGIGFAVAKKLLDMNWRVLLIGHTAENCDKAKAKLQGLYPQGEIVFFHGDLMHQRDVNRVADELNSYLKAHCDGCLQVLINNAGAVRTWYTTTEEGYEQQFALNHLAGFLLTHRLMGALKEAGGRMILTGSGSHKHYTIRWDDMMYQKRRYSCLGAYKQTKLCNLLFAGEFNSRFEKSGVRAYVVDPGLVSTDIGFKQTSGLVRAVWSMRKRQGIPPETAARTYGLLCSPSFSETGLYYLDSKKAPYDGRADKQTDRSKLFDISEKLCGIKAFGEVEA